jgi:hypothetical protein
MKFRAKPNSGTDGSTVPDMDESKNDMDSNDAKVSINIFYS